MAVAAAAAGGCNEILTGGSGTPLSAQRAAAPRQPPRSGRSRTTRRLWTAAQSGSAVIGGITWPPPRMDSLARLK